MNSHEDVSPPLTMEELVRVAHGQHAGIPYAPREKLLDHLPELMRALAEWVLHSQPTIGEAAYAIAALVNLIENAPARDRGLH